MIGWKRFLKPPSRIGSESFLTRNNMLNSNLTVSWKGEVLMPSRQNPVIEVGKGQPIINPQSGYFWQRSGLSTRPALPIFTIYDADVLSTFYTFRDYSRVAQFLIGHPEIGSFLLVSYDNLTNLSPEILRPALDIVVDPDSGTQRLFVLLPTTLPVAKARRILRDL